MIRQQGDDAIALTPNGNIQEGVQANVKVGETFATAYVSRIEVELQRTIDLIEDQEIVAPRQENANDDVNPQAQINGGEILYLTYYN